MTGKVISLFFRSGGRKMGKMAGMGGDFFNQMRRFIRNRQSAGHLTVDGLRQ